MLITSGLGEGLPEIWHVPTMSVEERRRRHGYVSMEPLEELVAGQYTTVSFTVCIGEEEILPGGQIGLNWRWPYDWGDLQVDDPSKDGYLKVTVAAQDSRVELFSEYRRKGGIEPWHHLLVIRLQEGRLQKGDEVHIICGYQGGGSSGWRAPTCRVRECGFLVLIDPIGSGRWTRLLDPPAFKIVADKAVHLLAVTASEGMVGQPISLRVRFEDKWGNPTHPVLSSLQVEKASGPGEVEVASESADNQDEVHSFRVKCAMPGLYTLKVFNEELGEVETNPIRISSERPELQLFWGDLHSGQTEIGCGAGTLVEHFRYGRDVAAVQFMTHQANDHYVTVNEWQITRRVSSAFNEPGKFVTFLGCEWSPVTEAGGDRNVFYRSDEPRLRRSGRYFAEKYPDPEPDIPTAPDFHRAFKNEDVLVGLHVGGRCSNLDYYEPQIERLAEVHSTHGTSEWFVEDALNRGYRVGITGGTDGVMTRPAADHPGWRLIRNVRNGLTAVYARELSREALWEALQARRCYATTGERILLWVDADGYPMGAEYEADNQPVINLRITGTNTLERVDLLRGKTRIHSWGLARWLPGNASGERFVRILWSGTSHKGTAHMQRLDWDGHLTVEGGEILEVSSVNFQSPCDTTTLENSKTVTWQSATAGGDAGILLRINASDEAHLHFSSKPATFSCSLSEVLFAPKVIDAGGFNRQVTIGPAPDPNSSRAVELTFQDEEVTEGWCPYWVRVVQIDCARAWSSPVYVMKP